MTGPLPLSMLVCLVVYLIYEETRPGRDDCASSNYDGTNCRPNWFSEILTPLEFLSSKLTEVGVYVLAGYLAHAYSRYRTYYWNARAVQDAITNLAFNMSTLCRMNANSNDFEMLPFSFRRVLSALLFFASKDFVVAIIMRQRPRCASGIRD